MTRIHITALGLLTAGLLAACSSEEAAVPQTTAPAVTAPATSTAPTQEAATGGNWITLADYDKDPAAFHEQGAVVLFFNATWCPTCQETVKNLDSETTPAGLTVVSVDYDSNEDLRQKYGVTVQHTFVEIDPDGQEQKKFTGSLTADQIAKQVA